MSTLPEGLSEDTVVLDLTRIFLRNRAALRRPTNYQEVGRVIGEQLCLNGLRPYPDPISRDRVEQALASIATDEEGLALVSVVIHFWDNDVGHQFPYWAGQLDHAFDTREDAQAFHRTKLEEVYAQYETPPVPDTPEGLLAEGEQTEQSAAHDL